MSGERSASSEHRSPEVGFPIRKSADQSLFAAPHGLSQRTTSFIASQRQGIHRMPLRHLIALMLNAHSPALARGPGHCSERPVSCLDSSVTPQPSSQAPLPKEQTDESLFTMSKTLEPHRAGAMGTPVAPHHASMTGTPDTPHCSRNGDPGCDAHGTAISWTSLTLVEPDGIEPTTSCLQSRRSPS